MSIALAEETLVTYTDSVPPLKVDHRIFEATTSIGNTSYYPSLTLLLIHSLMNSRDEA